MVHDAIYGELVKGIVRDETREAMLEVVRGLGARGAEGVVLGCTELGMVLKAEGSPLPLFDTAAIHAKHVAEWALA